MKHIKKIISLILIIGITAALLSGCGSSTKTMANTTKAKYEKALKNLVSADIISQEQSDKALVALMSTVSSKTTSGGSQFGGGNSGNRSGGGGSRSGGSNGGSGQYSGGSGQYSGGSGQYSGGSGQYSGGSSGSSKSSTTYNLTGLVRTGVITERQSAAIIKAIKDISGTSKKSQNSQEMQGREGGQGGQGGQSQGGQGGPPPQ